MVSERFAATGAMLRASVTSADGASSGVTSSHTSFGGGVSVSYDAASGGYTVRDGTSTVTFQATDINPAESNAVATLFQNTGTAQSEDLVLFNPGSSNTQLALTYVSYGAWQTVNDSSTGVALDQRYFVYGIRQGADLPSTGSASYATQVDGFWSTSTSLSTLSGVSTFSADFQNLTVATDLNLVGTDVVAGTSSALGLFRGAGTIAALGGGFTGTFAHQGTSAAGVAYSGGFDGAFFGPVGSEVGYTFRLTGADGVAVGAVVGKAN